MLSIHLHGDGYRLTGTLTDDERRIVRACVRLAGRDVEKVRAYVGVALDRDVVVTMSRIVEAPPSGKLIAGEDDE